MLRKISMFTPLLAQFITFHPSLSLAQDPGNSDTIRVPIVSAMPGSHIVVPVSGYSDELTAGYLIPLEYPSTSLHVDSISYAGTRFSPAAVKPFSIDSSNHRLTCGAIFFDSLPPGDGTLVRIHFSVSPSAVAETVVIDTFYQPPSVLSISDPAANEWVPHFKPGQIIIRTENPPPVWQPIGSVSTLEAESLTIPLRAHDPTGDPLTFTALNAPPGARLTSLSDSTAAFTWIPRLVGPYSSSGSPFHVIFRVSDGFNIARQDVDIVVINKNALPIFSIPDTVISPAEVNINFTVSAHDVDNQAVSIVALNLPSGANFDGGNPGAFDWTPSISQVGARYVRFQATDTEGGVAFDSTLIIVGSSGSYILSMPDKEAFTGELVTIPVSLFNRGRVGGCELLIHYDFTALILKSVSRSGTRISSWESFSSVTNPGGNAGDLQIVGLADLPNQTATPPLDSGQGPIVNLIFQVSENPDFAGFLIPIIFKFVGPLDNTLADDTGALIGQDSLTYKNGGIFIKPLNTLIGDINLNGIAFDIGDAVALAAYLSDPVAHPLNVQQLANSDVNQDGVPASIADLVFLMHSITGGPGAAATDKPISGFAAGKVTIEIDGAPGESRINLQSDVPVGGLVLTFEHRGNQNLTPVFSEQLGGFETRYSDRDGTLTVLIFDRDGKALPIGETELFKLNTEKAYLSKSQASDSYGYLLQTESIQKDEVSNGRGSHLELGQNYPNPFNQETVVSLSLAHGTKVKLEVYNILGEKVKTLINEDLTAGRHQVRWDGSNNSGQPVASGVYFYRLSGDGETQTKKLNLLK